MTYNREKFWSAVRAEVSGHLHGVMIAELAIKLESNDEPREMMYSRLYACAQCSEVKDKQSAVYKGLGYYRVSTRSYRVFLPEETFVPPTQQEHERELRAHTKAAKHREFTGVTHGLSRVPVSRQQYEQPRKRVKICKLCYELPHVRPPEGCPMCGRPRGDEPKPMAPDHQYNRMVIP